MSKLRGTTAAMAAMDEIPGVKSRSGDWPPPLEPDDGLGPTITGPQGYMSEATRLTRRVLLLERAIRDAVAVLQDGCQAHPPGEREARALNILTALPIPER